MNPPGGAGDATASAAGAADSAVDAAERVGGTGGHADGSDPDPSSIADLWDELVTTSLLGADRRDPPTPPGAVGDLVADTVRPTPSGRMLALVAAVVAVRRAGFVAGPVLPPLAAPPDDPRPVCSPAAVARWRHVTTSWPVLEDEWLLALVAGGRRAGPEMVPDLLRRHRRDPVRRARATLAAGPLAAWLVEHLPELAPGGAPASVDPETVASLPDLPIPPELRELIERPGAETGRTIAEALASGALAIAHRSVLVNLLARVRPDGLTDIARALGRIDPGSPTHGFAASLADLATTRRRMLDELDADG